MDDLYAEKIKVQLINDSPLFNSYVEVDSIATPYYNASEFSLINLTLNDTLYMKSEFKGGEGATDAFDLNLYYTIDENNKSVLGVKRSSARFKDTPWLINAAQNTKNKITFDRDFKEVTVDNLNMSYGQEEMLLNALIQGSENKEINLDFKDVNFFFTFGLIAVLMVLARSCADIPVVIPFFASIETVNAVCILDLFTEDINGNFNISTCFFVSARQIKPLPCLAIKFILL